MLLRGLPSLDDNRELFVAKRGKNSLPNLAQKDYRGSFVIGSKSFNYFLDYVSWHQKRRILRIVLLFIWLRFAKIERAPKKLTIIKCHHLLRMASVILCHFGPFNWTAQFHTSRPLLSFSKLILRAVPSS